MENLRWILIFAGVAILVLLYFSGRGSTGKASNTRSARVRRDDFDADPSIDDTDPLLGQPVQHTANRARGFEDFDEVDPRDLERPAAQRPQTRPAATQRVDDPIYEEDLQADDGYLPPELQAESRAPGLTETAAGALGGLSQKIESIGAKLSGKRRERVAENPPPEFDEEEPVYASKIITLHLVAGHGIAGHGALFDGQALLNTFEQREYTFGEMNIFHSMHNGKSVFSVAKMVEPGWFDPQNIESFATPGITFILQLPGPVAADTAFEVLLSEAYEIANELGGTLIDSDHSTLSKQSAQHMREGVYEYMHRQKYFGSVAS
jgi:cell division protein ZipA